jgi:RNA-directed DNA polymerase
MRSGGADGPVVAKKPGNAGGAKRPDNPAEETGQPVMGGAGDRGKPYNIPKQLVWSAYREVKANQGAAGVDGQSLVQFEQNLEDNLYKIWNRMASGSYFPPPVRLVEIPKSNGGTRGLGVPTVADRIAQMVVKMVLEPLVESAFHRDSYGYRPHRSALRAVGEARRRCWEFDWVIDLDIKSFFDTLDWDLVERAVAWHTQNPWVRLYIGRWLRAPLMRPDGSIQARTRGTPQGGVISPLLANLFLHYAFDAWMGRKFPGVRFERYADDSIVHCTNLRQAQAVLTAIGERFAQCGLELHPTKTRIVYCQDDRRRGKFECVSFDFLGYTFRPRPAKSRAGKRFVGFLPAMSGKAAQAVRTTIRQWRIASSRSQQSLEELARLVNPAVRGWLNYYGRFYRSRCVQVVQRAFKQALTAWARRKFKRLRGRKFASLRWLERIERRDPRLFAFWELAAQPQGWIIGAG